MSDWYEKIKADQEKLAKELTPLPKDLAYFSKFNNLKMAVLQKIDADKKEGKIAEVDAVDLETFRVNDKFGFKERLVNVLMHYAFEAGVKSGHTDYSHRTAEMSEALEKIKNALDDIGYIPGCNCDN